MSANTTVLITGATSGIGYATAQRLLAEGAHVLVHGPTIREAEQAMLHLIEDGATPGAVWPVAGDFTRLDEVSALALTVSARHGRLDVLINNAAAAASQGRRVTDDGHERTFQVNYLAPFLLTRLLTPLLRASHGRMVAVSSSLHRSRNINWGDPQRMRHYAPVPAYAQSKLALTMFARALAQQHTDLTRIRG